MPSVAIPHEPLPFDVAEEYFADKLQLPPGQFAKLREEAQSRAFALAGVAKADVLATVHGELLRAIREGTTLADFRKGISDIADERGWTGWRTETIFRTNVGSAYEAGHWAQLQEMNDPDAVVVYDAVGDSDTRPAHQAMDGKAFRADDAIWNEWWPPNGFNCRCTTRTMSSEEAAARGVQVESTSAGLPKPDPGFQHNAGQTYFGGLEDVDGPWSEAPDLAGPERYRRRAAHNIRAAELPELPVADLLPEGLSAEESAEAFRKAFGIERPGGERVVTDAVGDPVVLSEALWRTAGGKWKIDKRGRGSWVTVLPRLITDPYEVWLTPMLHPDGRVQLRKRYVQIWRTADKERVSGVVIMEVQKGRMMGVSAFPPDDLGYLDDVIRRGVLLKGA